MPTRTIPTLLAALLTTNALAQLPAQPTPPAPLKGLTYDADFFPGAHHDKDIPTPDSVLGFRLGDKPATHAQVEAVIKAIAAKSPRVKLFPYATSHEGRTLYYLAVTSKTNISRLDAIKTDAAKLADPRNTPADQTDKLSTSIPAIAWMAYAIHGNEMSGTDASLALLWHLASSTDKDVTDLLDNVVVLIDPLMNPDGRDRCITGIQQNRTAQPAVDEQSIIHNETWPEGRTNHYFFDLNRDWIWCSQPETRGRVKAVNEWNPHYFVESHEQSPLDTFLFMPPRAPINPNIPDSIHKWSDTFGNDQAKALDAFGWRYYTGEWNEEWYPGYSGSWAALRGSIDNLYEQARIITDAVRRPEGTLEAYREAVHKQLVSSLANLTTLKDHHAEVVSDFLKERRAILADNSPFATRLFVITGAEGNTGRWQRLLDLLQLQNIEAYELTENLTADARDALGRPLTSALFMKGTIVIPASQPLGRLATALFELDPRMTPEFLTEERRELLRFGQSRLYDITGWNAAMMFGLDTFELDAKLPPTAKRAAITAATQQPAGAPKPATTPTAWFLDGRDDRSIALAARLMDLGVKVRCTNKSTRLDQTIIPRGSFIIARNDNTLFAGNLSDTLTTTAKQFGPSLTPLTTGMGPGDLPDLGGQHFVLLETPRIAILTGSPFDPNNVGEIWHLVDHELGLRAALLNSPVDAVDLRRYNVLVIPDTYAEGQWPEKLPTLKAWVEAGGTLIAIGNAAAPIARDKTGIGETRLLPDVLDKLEPYRAAIIRDWLAKTTTPDPTQVWSYTPPTKLDYPWSLADSEKLEEPELKRRDAWRDLFSPTGALLAARVDDRHWLTAGCDETLPVLIAHGPILLTPSGGNAPLLLGAIVPAPTPPKATPTDKQPKDSDSKKADNDKPSDKKADQKNAKDDKKDKDAKDSKDSKDKDESPKPGWLLAPPGHELRLRMSGLLWPEAADRLAHSAYCTQESLGRGQVILFSYSPTFRDASRGTTRLLTNALICGPGMGASHPIRP